MIQFMGADKIEEIVSDLKYYNKRLKRIDTVENRAKNGGLIARMNEEERYGLEAEAVERLRLIKDLVSKRGDAAIDYYLELTTMPDTAHPMYEKLKVLDHLTGLSFVDDLFIRMKKEEIPLWINLYNKYFRCSK